MKQNATERRDAKRAIIARLTAAGVNFEKSAFSLGYDERAKLSDEAARNHYRRPAGSYFALAGSYFNHLKKYL